MWDVCSLPNSYICCYGHSEDSVWKLGGRAYKLKVAEDKAGRERRNPIKRWCPWNTDDTEASSAMTTVKCSAEVLIPLESTNSIIRVARPAVTRAVHLEYGYGQLGIKENKTFHHETQKWWSKRELKSLNKLFMGYLWDLRIRKRGWGGKKPQVPGEFSEVLMCCFSLYIAQ